MADVVFVEELTRGRPRAWTVRDRETGEVLGGVEWLERFGAHGFGAAPGVAAFSDPTVMREVGRFLDEVNDA